MKIKLANPKLITWARERAGFEIDQLAEKVNLSISQLRQIERGQEVPSKAQLDRIAAQTYVPLGFLLLNKPPHEELPVPDFRTKDNKRPKKISANLWDSIHDAQHKQNWLREHLIANAVPPLSLIGMHKNRKSNQVVDIAKSMRKHLNIEEKPDIKNKEEYLTDLMERSEQAGILIIRNGVVYNNPFRKLDPQEFRGFALCDEYAPVIFINGQDYQAAQIFTLAHELAHLFLGTEGLDDPMGINADEDLCNRVAAEFLVPRAGFVAKWRQTTKDIQAKIEELAKEYAVSNVVIARCALSHKCITHDFYWRWWHKETKRLEGLGKGKKGSGGGNFHYLLRWRSGGKKFSLALGRSVQGMKTTYTEAFQLLNIKGSNTFKAYMKHLGLDL